MLIESQHVVPAGAGRTWLINVWSICVLVRMLRLLLLNEHCVLVEIVCLKAHGKICWLRFLTQQPFTSRWLRYSVAWWSSLWVCCLVWNAKGHLRMLGSWHRRRAFLLSSINIVKLRLFLISLSYWRPEVFIMMRLVWALWRERNQILEIVSSRAASVVGLFSSILAIFIDLEVQHILLIGVQLKGLPIYLVALILDASAVHVFLGDHDGLIAAFLVHSLLALVLRIVLAFIVLLHSW